MKARIKPQEIDYLVWDGNSDSLQIWMNEFKEEIKDFFKLKMHQFEDDELFLKLSFGFIPINVGKVIIRSKTGYAFISQEDFNEKYEVYSS